MKPHLTVLRCGTLILAASAPSWAAPADGWQTLRQARSTLSPADWSPDRSGVAYIPTGAEAVRNADRNVRRNAKSLALTRRALGQSLDGKPVAGPTERVAAEVCDLGYALIEEGRLKEWHNQHAAAQGAYLDAMKLASRVLSGRRYDDPANSFRLLNRMAGIARLEIFYGTVHMSAGELLATYARWSPLNRVPVAPRVEASNLQEVALALKGLMLENVALDTAFHLRKFTLRFGHSASSPDDLKKVGFKGLSLDPFAPGQPLRWKVISDAQKGPRILVYSAGPNGTWEDGAPLQNPRSFNPAFDSPVLDRVQSDASGDLEVLRFRFSKPSDSAKPPAY